MLPQRLSCARFEIRADERLLLVAGESVSIGSRAFDVLVCLARDRDRVVSKDELLAAAWPGMVVEDNNLSVQIAALRKLLGAAAISTVTGVGYRFTAPVDEVLRPPAGSNAGGSGASKRADDAAPGAALDAAPRQAAGPPPGAARPDPHAPAGAVPSLAVMPFANLSGDPGQDYFVAGVVDDITRALARVRRFSVIARRSSDTYKGRSVDAATVGRELGVRYLVEGSFRQAGDRLRIGVQLVETVNGHQVWSEHYDGIREDVFELQDQITAHVVAAIEPNLFNAELARVRQRPTESLAAYELCLRALAAATRSASHDEVMRTIELLRRALEIDAGYPLAKALMAWAWAMAWANRWVDHKRASACLPLALDAVADHREDPYTLAFAGHAIAVLGRDHEQARRALSMSLALNPNSIYTLSLAGWVSAYAGDGEAALRHFERAIDLDPLVAGVGHAHCGIAYAHLIADHPAQALVAARQGALAIPEFVPGRLALLHALVRTNHMEEAKTISADVLALMPRLTISRYASTQLFINPGFRQRCSEDLRALGVPE